MYQPSISMLLNFYADNVANPKTQIVSLIIYLDTQLKNISFMSNSMKYVHLHITNNIYCID